MITVLSFIIVLGILIFVHEFGHFLMAKRAGVGVLTFSFGLGPRLITLFKRGGTEYILSAIPFGGYVKMVGEDPKEEEGDPEKSFAKKPVGWRSLIVLAGPAFNFLLAIVLFWGIFTVGIPILGTKIGEVKEGFPAAQSGLQPGDRIAALEGQPVTRWEELASRIHQSPGRAVRITVEREGRRFDLTLVPQPTKQKNFFGEEQEIGLLGIAPAEEFIKERADPFTALYRAIYKTYDLSRLIILSLIKLLQGTISPTTIGGPLLIAQMAGEQAKQGLLALLSLTALLSINLGILNLLPIPILDGGHLLFAAIEAIRGKPVKMRTREVANYVGLAFLVAVMIYATRNDIFRIFGKP